MWVRKVYQERDLKDEYHMLIKEIMLQYNALFFAYFHMSPTKYEQILAIVVLYELSHKQRYCLTSSISALRKSPFLLLVPSSNCSVAEKVSIQSLSSSSPTSRLFAMMIEMSFAPVSHTSKS